MKILEYMALVESIGSLVLIIYLAYSEFMDNR